MPSIRWRICIFVFLFVALLQVTLSLYVLARVRRVQIDEIDSRLAEEVDQVVEMLGTPALAAFLDNETLHDTKWTEELFELRAADGSLLYASSNVPPAGLGSARQPERVARRRGPLISVWERVHPASRKGHVRIRVAEAVHDGNIVRVAHTLKMAQKTWWRLREQLGWGNLGVAVLAAFGAWAVAKASLRPLDRIARQARLLGASAAGELPVSTRGDEVDRLAHVLNDMLRRTRSEVSRVRRLGADAAHALRTPLTAIRGHLELLTGAEQRSPGLAHAIEALDDAVGTVNQLLELERIESHPIDGTSAEHLRLDTLTEDVVDAMSAAATERHVDMKCTSAPVWVRGEARQLRHAILNLIDNALGHTPAGGRVDVTVRLHRERAEVAVEDTGPGLRPDQIERVFERFYSERPDGPPGTGLGIPIAQAVARAHGGELHAASPRGARFVIALPPSTQPGSANG